MSTALRVLRQDCAQTARGAFGAWSRARTSHRLIHFFSLGKVVDILHV